MRLLIFCGAFLLCARTHVMAFLVSEKLSPAQRREHELAIFSYGLETNPLASAACSGDFRGMNFFLSRDGTEKIDEFGLTALAVAALRGDALAARRLMLLGADPRTIVTYAGKQQNVFDLAKELAGRGAQYVRVERVISDLSVTAPSRLYVDLFFEVANTKVDEIAAAVVCVYEQTAKSNVPGFFNALDRICSLADETVELVALLAARLAECPLVSASHRNERTLALRHRISLLCFELGNHVHAFVDKTSIVVESRQDPFRWQRSLTKAAHLLAPTRRKKTSDKNRPMCFSVGTLPEESACPIAAV